MPSRARAGRAAPPGRHRRPVRADPARGPRGARQGARRPARRRRVRRDERLCPRGPDRRARAAAGRRHRRPSSIPTTPSRSSRTWTPTSSARCCARWSPTIAPRSRKRCAIPEESAGRLMQRELIAVPEHWTVGDAIDYLRGHDELTTDFWEIFVVDPAHKPVGTCQLSWILRTPRGIAIGRRDEARADADPGRHGPGRSRAALPEIRADLGRRHRCRRAAGRDDHGRRHRPHHLRGSRRGHRCGCPARATATSTSRSR